uniref:Secreted protein n=1 Tax=Strongyloides papillosus TaxID=174720 RepID=A0A0N5BTS0_STREA
MIISNYIKQFIFFCSLIDFVNSVLPPTGMNFGVGTRGRPGFYNPQHKHRPGRRGSWHVHYNIRPKSPKRHSKKRRNSQPKIEITRL